MSDSNREGCEFNLDSVEIHCLSPMREYAVLNFASQHCEMPILLYAGLSVNLKKPLRL